MERSRLRKDCGSGVGSGRSQQAEPSDCSLRNAGSCYLSSKCAFLFNIFLHALSPGSVSL